MEMVQGWKVAEQTGERIRCNNHTKPAFADYRLLPGRNDVARSRRRSARQLKLAWLRRFL